jgi:hypothetical protein
MLYHVAPAFGTEGVFLMPSISITVLGSKFDNDVTTVVESQKFELTTQKSENGKSTGAMLADGSSQSKYDIGATLTPKVATTGWMPQDINATEKLIRAVQKNMDQKINESIEWKGAVTQSETSHRKQSTEKRQRPHLKFTVEIKNNTDTRVAFMNGFVPVFKYNEYLGNAFPNAGISSQPLIISPLGKITLFFECEITSVSQVETLKTTGQITMDFAQSTMEIYSLDSQGKPIVERNLLNDDITQPHWLLYITEAGRLNLKRVRIGTSVADAVSAALSPLPSLLFGNLNDEKVSAQSTECPQANDVLIIFELKESHNFTPEAIQLLRQYESEIDLLASTNAEARHLQTVIAEAKQVQSLLVEANKYWEKQDLYNMLASAKAAIELLEKGSYHNEIELGRAYFSQGMAFLNAGKKEEAAASFHRAIQYGVNCHTELGRAYGSNMPQESLGQYKTAYQLTKNARNFWWYFQQQGLTPQKMLEAFEDASLEKDYLFFHYRVGIRNALAHQLTAENKITIATLHYDQAIFDHELNIQRCLEFGTTSPEESYHWLAYWHLHRLDGRGDLQKALSLITKEIEIRSEFANAYELRIAILEVLLKNARLRKNQVFKNCWKKTERNWRKSKNYIIKCNISKFCCMELLARITLYE